jgi:hypothetical protein
LLASIAAFIAAHTMVRQQRALPVTAITTMPAVVHIGTQAFAAAGTNKTGNKLLPQVLA